MQQCSMRACSFPAASASPPDRARGALRQRVPQAAAAGWRTAERMPHLGAKAAVKHRVCLVQHYNLHVAVVQVGLFCSTTSAVRCAEGWTSERKSGWGRASRAHALDRQSSAPGARFLRRQPAAHTEAACCARSRPALCWRSAQQHDDASLEAATQAALAARSPACCMTRCGVPTSRSSGRSSASRWPPMSLPPLTSAERNLAVCARA
jgi:hypothetical protein